MSARKLFKGLIIVALPLVALLFAALLIGKPVPVRAAREAGPLYREWCGLIDTDTTWTEAESPHVVTCDVTVDAGVTLTIEAGVTVQFQDAWDDLHVNGTLMADGTGGQITFTSAQPSPAPHDWGGIHFNASSSGSVLEHTWIGYGGGYDSAANVEVYTNDVTIRDNVIGWSSEDGIRVYDASPTIENNTIRDNPSDGIEFDGFDGTRPVTLTGNTFISNTNSAVWANLSDEVVDVTLVGNSSTGSDRNGFAMKGAISGTVTYDDNANFPFIVVDDVTVQEPASLTFTPGTVVKFNDGWDHLVINGSLVAQGTDTQQVVFTSLKDDAHGGDTNGDGSTTSPVPDDWGSINFHASSSGNLLEYVWISYAGGTYSDANVNVWSSDVTIQNSTIAWSYVDGIAIWDASPTIENNTIRDNPSDGIEFDGFDGTRPVTLTGNTFISNTNSAVWANLSDEVVDVTLVGNTSTGSDRNGFAMKGYISGTVTYDDNADFPFIVVDDVTVQEPASLSFTPGTVVKFNDGWDHLVVNGSLVAQGTDTQQVVFTSLKDDTHGGDTNGDGSATSPVPDDWGSINFNASSSGNLLEYVWIGYAGGAYSDANVNVWSSDVTIQNSTIAWASGNGIYVQNASPTIESNLIYGNYCGIHTTDGAQPTLHGNAIFNNSNYGVYNDDTSVIVDAIGNWWGSPSGPYHPTANPDGEGDWVSDYVLFTPWMRQPPAGMVMDELIFGLSGPGSASPGQTVYYAISYANLTTRTVESAVIMLALPYAAEYVDSTGDGIFWPERHQVFWKLGDLAPGTSGRASVRMRFAWGLPDGLEDDAMALLGGTNLEECPFDVSLYLAYTPREVLDEVALTEAQVEAERLAYPDLDTIYTQAVADGFIFGYAARLTVSSGEVITQVVLIQTDERAVMYLRRQEDQVRASTFDPTSYAVRDATGGMTWDFQLNTVEYWGSWAPATGGLSVQAGFLATGECFFNCISENLPGWVIGNKISAIGHVLNAADCYACTRGDLSACGKCGGSLKGIPGVGEAIDTYNCGEDCYDDPDSHLCTEDKITCDQSWWNVYSWMGVSNYKRIRCRNGRYDALPEILTCASGDKCVEDKGCVNCSSHPEACAKDETTVRIARDPNAKYGSEADLLPGQLVTYTITYENEGAGQASGVFVTDELCEHFDESTLTLYGGGQIFTAIRILLWQVGDLAPKGEPGSEGTISFTVQLKDNLPGGTVIVNQAVVYFPSVPEETPTNSVVNVIQTVSALPQTVETEAGQPVAITLQGVDVGGAPLSYSIVEEPLYGALTGVAPTLVYTPMVTFSGLDRFTFQASNGITESRPAEVSILVHPWSGDTTPPEIEWTKPKDGALIEEIIATPVLTDAVGPAYAPFPLVQFSEVISATTVTTETVQMVDDGQPVAISVKYDGTVNQAIIILREPLQYNTQYTVTVGQGVKDLIGNPLEADYTWSFSTGSPSSQIYLPVVLRNH